MPDPRQRLEWFPFFPKDWMDFRVLRMSLEAQGAYIRLLCHCWNDSPDQASIPADLKQIAKVLGVSKTKAKKILSEFSQNGDPIFIEKGGRYFSKRLAEEKYRGDKLREKRSLAGSKGASARWPAQPADDDTSKNCDGIAIDLPMAKRSYLPVPVQEQKPEGGVLGGTYINGDPTPSPLLDFLFGLSIEAKTPNRPERIRAYLSAWAERFGASAVESVLRSSEAQGRDIVALAKILDAKYTQAETARNLVSSALQNKDEK